MTLMDISPIAYRKVSMTLLSQWRQQLAMILQHQDLVWVVLVCLSPPWPATKRNFHSGPDGSMRLF